MDEATASLDADNEYQIQESIKSIIRGKTVIVIAHRLNTIKDSDRIILFDNGRIIEQGSHRALLDMNGKYAGMYHSIMKSKDWTL